MRRISNPELLKEIRQKPCLACGYPKSDAAHIKSKGSGGPEVELNLIPLCRVCHTSQHTQGWSMFLKKNIRVAKHIESLGWYFDAEGKLRNDGLVSSTDS